MHIVHLVPEMQQGGVETVVAELNRALVKAGHACTVISAGGKMTEQIVRDGGRHITLDVCSKNPLTVPARVRALQKILCALRPAPCILHAHSRVPAWLAWYANRRLRRPFVTTVHGFNSVSRYSAVMTKGDRVICVSRPVRDYIRTHYGTDERIIRVVHGGIDPERFNPEKVDADAVDRLKAHCGLSGRKVVTSIGRITELKDFETFIRAVAKAVRQDPALTGLIVGHVRRDKQACFERLKALIRALKMEEHIKIVTDITDPVAVYAASDVVVSCSKKPESFGLTLVEALAMNVPVIATRHGGPLDIIRENENGFFFAPGDADELAVKLRGVPEKADCRFRENVLREFSIDRMAAGHLAVYQELCGAE